MLKADRTRRPRRIAADEAHAWARNLRLGNHHAKSVLRSLTLYVDGNGDVFTGIDQLADDCELSPDTVRRRLVWLEEIGAIVRRAQWIDDRGCRNGDARGKRTTDLIRLCFDGETALIEARARGETVDDDESDGGFSPSSQQGLNPASKSVSPAPALRQPSQSCDPLISEPEPESPLTSPPGRREPTMSDDEGSEPEHFAAAWHGWPGHQVMRRDLALSEFRQLAPDKQLLCRAAVPLFAFLQAKLGRTRVMNFHLWIRSRGFEEFPHAKLAVAPVEPVRRWVSGDELAGLLVAARMVDRGVPRVSDDPERGRGFLTTAAPRPDIEALSQFADQDSSDWQIVDQGAPQFAAWRDRLMLWFGTRDIHAQRVWREDVVAGVHDVPVMHPNFRLRRERLGFRVPALWPPRRDGTWGPEGEGA